MILEPEEYPYVARTNAAGEIGLVPLLPIKLTGLKVISTSGLLDSGASINVPPYQVGLDLGAVWERLKTPAQLTGNLAPVEARVLVVEAAAGHFPEVRLAFAWARTDTVALLLGQVNFFMGFDVCFHRSRSTFDIKPSEHSSISGGH